MITKKKGKLGAPAPAFGDGECSCNDYGTDRNRNQKPEQALLHDKQKQRFDTELKNTWLVSICM